MGRVRRQAPRGRVVRLSWSLPEGPCPCRLRGRAGTAPTTPPEAYRRAEWDSAGLASFRNNPTYFPYPSASSLSTGMNRSDAEFMQ